MLLMNPNQLPFGTSTNGFGQLMQSAGSSNQTNDKGMQLFQQPSQVKHIQAQSLLQVI